MSLPELNIDAASIVMVGNFNPTTITPASLAAAELLGKDEALSALSPLLTPNLAVFDAAWLHAEITEVRIQITTAEPTEAIRLCDMATGILAMSPVPPISAIGLNRSVHFEVESPEQWHTIGDRLLSKEDWKGVLDLPGTRRVVIMGMRSDDFMGQIQVTIEPSMRMTPGAVGVFIEHNDHYLLRKTDAQPKTRNDFLDPTMQQPNYIEPSTELIPLAREIITSRWSDSMTRAERVIENVWNMRTGG